MKNLIVLFALYLLLFSNIEKMTVQAADSIQTVKTTQTTGSDQREKSVRALKPVPVLFDTDMDTDCDDLGAMAVLHAMADQNEIQILATVCSSKYPYSAPCIQAVNRYYNRPNIPVGVPKGAGASIDRGSIYAKIIAERFLPEKKTNDDYPDAVTVWRKAFADADDNSLIVVTVGYLTNAAAFLASEPDTISELSGRDLAEKKILRFVCMGGRYPQQLSFGDWGNFMPDPSAVQKVYRNWPCPIIFSGDGEKVLTGSLLNRTPKENPVRMGYELYLKGKKSRPSWDPITLLFAVRPNESFWKITTRGYNHIFENGTNQWRDKPDSSDILVQIQDKDNEKVRETIDELMSRRPKKQEIR